MSSNLSSIEIQASNIPHARKASDRRILGDARPVWCRQPAIHGSTARKAEIAPDAILEPIRAVQIIALENPGGIP